MEYLPPLQLPTGLAEQLIQLRSQAGNPWAALAENLGKDVNQGILGYAQAKANRPLTPDQLAAIKAGQVPAGLTRQQQLEVAAQQSSLAERMAASKEATNRAITAQQLRNQGADERNKVPVDDVFRASYKKASGHDFPAYVDQIPKDEYDKVIASGGKAQSGIGTYADVRSKLGELGELDKIQKATNPATAGGVVHLAGVNNARADRALVSLNDPNIVAQQLSAVSTDLAGIMQMGSPHDIGLKDQDYTNIQTKIAKFLSDYKSSPQPINDPELTKRLKSIVNDVKSVDNKIIVGNLDATEKGSQRFFEVYPKSKKSWDDYREQIEKNWVNGDSQNSDNAPKVGTIIKGYKFKGGDPSDKSNWEKQ